MLDEIIEKEIPKVPKNQNVQKHEQQIPQTPTSVVGRSSRLSRPLEWYSPSLYYLLLIDFSKLEKYKEVIYYLL